jgi:hypothetical protein
MEKGYNSMARSCMNTSAGESTGSCLCSADMTSLQVPGSCLQLHTLVYIAQILDDRPDSCEILDVCWSTIGPYAQQSQVSILYP